MHKPHGRCASGASQTMKLLVFYIVFVAIGEAIAYAAGRTVEVWSPATSLPVFLSLLFLHAVGRVAARREGGLSSGSTTHAFVKGTAGVARGFLPFDTRKYVEWKEDVMTDPRFTDPRYNDPRLSDPVLRRDDSAAGGMWGWIAGVAVLLLIGFLIIAGWNNNSNTASSGSSPTATSSAPMSSTPSTTGSGSTSPKPLRRRRRRLRPQPRRRAARNKLNHN